MVRLLIQICRGYRAIAIARHAHTMLVVAELAFVTDPEMVIQNGVCQNALESSHFGCCRRYRVEFAAHAFSTDFTTSITSIHGFF